MKKTNHCSAPLFREKTAVWLLICSVVFLFAACSVEDVTNTEEEILQPDPVDENGLMDRVFRIDILSMDVQLNYRPGDNLLEGESVVRFRMRPDQTVPLVHFDLDADDWVEYLELDGEALDFDDTSDAKIISFTETTQKGIELQRTCSGDEDHILKVRYTIGYTNPYRSFYADVNDIFGTGNEVIFPTINCPSELIRHRIIFSVESEDPYILIGSGNVVPFEERGQKKWLLDTEREVASYTVMWMMAPSEDVEYEERAVNGVDVRIMTYKDSVSIETAFQTLESWLPELESNIGGFPMERGLSVFLTQRGGGMEYFGGTITSQSALEHEVFHMYYGCSVVAKTYRDSWWDEAINMWYEFSAAGTVTPVNDDFTSDIVSGRTPVSVGFNDRAYSDGARVIETIASELGGRQVFIDLLSHIHAGHRFDPFNTFQLIGFIHDYSGIDFEERMIQWLYSGARTYYSTRRNEWSDHHRADMTPPRWVMKKYGK